MRGKVAEHPIPDLLGKTIDAPFPENGLVYDYFYVVNILAFKFEFVSKITSFSKPFFFKLDEKQRRVASLE